MDPERKDVMLSVVPLPSDKFLLQKQPDPVGRERLEPRVPRGCRGRCFLFAHSQLGCAARLPAARAQ